MNAPKKKAPAKRVPSVPIPLQGPPTIEERLEEVERKVDAIYNRIVQEASAQMMPVVQEKLKAQIVEGILNG